MKEVLTLDQVVGLNVARLREVRKLSRRELADKLNVPRHVIYELEGATRQRVIKLPDLVALAGVFEVVLAELLLPPEGAEVDVDWAWPLVRQAWNVEVGEGEHGPSFRRTQNVTRDVLSYHLFGAPAGDAVRAGMYRKKWVKDFLGEIDAQLEPLRRWFAETGEEE